MKPIRIGAGAGYSGDRIDPAVELAEKGSLSYLVFECLAERTIAIAQKSRLLDPSAGYDPLLEERMEAVLPHCSAQRIRIISNMGAANPNAAAEKTCEIRVASAYAVCASLRSPAMTCSISCVVAIQTSKNLKARCRPSRPGSLPTPISVSFHSSKRCKAEQTSS